MKHTLGFIGLGLMGFPMAMRLLKAGYGLSVNTRRKERAAGILDLGALWCDTPGQVASGADVVFSMVPDSRSLREIGIGQGGVLSSLREGGIHVDCSTVSAFATEELARIYTEAGRRFLHAPVLGSVPQVEDGSLLMFVGGDAGAVGRIEPFLKILSGRYWRFETPQQASYAKIICNSFIGGTFAMLAQGLVMAQKSGVGGERMLEILSHSTLSSGTIQFKGRRILERNFTPRFFLEYLLKDTNLMVEAGSSLGVPTPLADLVRTLLVEAVEKGLGREDYSAAIKVWEERAGTVALLEEGTKETGRTTGN